MMQILGLDTSNYTTSAALLDLEHGTVQQAKQLLPVKAGEAGLRQSDAVFHHTRQLPDMLEQLAPQLAAEELCAIGVSARPRNLEGSYMPCFLTGLGTARGIAAVTGVPLHVTSHQIGHVLAALYSAKKLELCRAPFLAFHVSGGTTDSLYCEPDAADYALRNLAGSESRTSDRSGGLAAGTAISLRCSAGTAGAEKPCENACASGHS